MNLRNRTKEFLTRSMDILMIYYWHRQWVRGIVCIAAATAFLVLYGAIISLLPVIQWPVGR